MDIAPLWLSLQLAFVTTMLLIFLGAPLAWWLSQSRSRWQPIVQAIVAMPIVLPPTVLGFYLLIVLGPEGAIGSWWVRLTGDTLTFSFVWTRDCILRIQSAFRGTADAECVRVIIPQSA